MEEYHFILSQYIYDMTRHIYTGSILQITTIIIAAAAVTTIITFGFGFSSIS